MATLLTELYDEFATDYERTRVPRFRPLVKQLLQLYDTRPGSRVLDAGCGTGLAATMVAPRVGHTGRVLGVDASSAMLEIARHKAHGYGFDQCVFAVGDIAQLDFPAETFDVVLCSFALWGEPDLLFTEFLRVLKPGGALLVQNWEHGNNPLDDAYAEALRAFTPPSDARINAVQTFLDQQRTYMQNVRAPQDYERVLRAVGFTHVAARSFSHTTTFKTLDEFIDFQNLGVAHRSQVAAMLPPTRADFYTAAVQVLTPFVTARGIDQIWRVIQVSARK